MVVRDLTVAGQCGVPVTAAAVSVNLAVTNMSSNGNLIVFPSGTATPTISALNWIPSEIAISNAAVVAMGSGGAVSVVENGPAGATVDLIVDVNGYYGGSAGLGAPRVVDANGTQIGTLHDPTSAVAFFAGQASLVALDSTGFAQRVGNTSVTRLYQSTDCSGQPLFGDTSPTPDSPDLLATTRFHGGSIWIFPRTGFVSTLVQSIQSGTSDTCSQISPAASYFAAPWVVVPVSFSPPFHVDP
jgi:hypothetical protein